MIMARRSKPKSTPKIEKLDQREAEELTPEQAEKARGGSFDVENPSTIGSATSGAGASKIKF